jgi:hypothetical protein
MGLFADLSWVDGKWTAAHLPGKTELTISIHDSDIATVTFAPADQAKGLFYLGVEPATYFEDPAASALVDHSAEATAFAVWARRATGRAIDPTEVTALMATPGRIDTEDDFVEDTVQRLLALIGLEMPDIPQGDE